MRIVLIAPANSVHTLRWCNALVNECEVYLISLHSPVKGYHRSIKIMVLPFKAPLGYFFNAFSLKKILNQISPNIVHVHYATGYGFLGMLANINKAILSVWGSDILIFPKRSLLHKFLLKKILLSYPYIISTSKVMAKIVKKIAGKKISVEIVPFGVETDKFTFKRTNQSTNITIGYVKNLEPIYGIDKLINSFFMIINDEACKKFNLRLLLVGEGKEKEHLTRLVKDLDIKNYVEFKGFVPHSQLNDVMKQIDIFCNLSISESFGVSTLEAMSCGLTIVASNTLGSKELISEGKTGIIIHDTNIKVVAHKIIELILDVRLRKRLGLAARKHVKKNYDWEQNVKKQLDIYKKVLGCNFW